MSQQERAIDRIRPGTIKPNAELRQSLDESQKCKMLFGGLIDEYLTSVNEAYLMGKGIVTAPQVIISDRFTPTGEPVESALLELSKTSWGGIKSSLEFELEQKKVIYVYVFYSSGFNYFSLILEASIEEKSDRENAVLKGKCMERRFYLNPNKQITDDVSDLLLTFTSELLDEGIL